MKIFIFILPFWMISLAGFAQSDEITGPNPAYVEDTETYQYDGVGFGNDFFFETDGGTVSLPQRSGTAYICQVTWTSIGTHSLKLFSGNQLSSTLIAETTILVEELVILPPPGTPDDPVLGTNPTCGPKRINRTGTPPDGVKWYWQSSLHTNPTTDLGDDDFIMANSSGSYYLRARNTSGGEAWSTDVSGAVTVTINPIPQKPDVPTINYYSDGLPDQLGCYSRGEIIKPVAPGGITYYWQGTDADGESADYTEPDYYTIDRSGIYYLRARDNSSLCWSESRSIDVSFVGAFKPLLPVVFEERCGEVTLEKQQEPIVSGQIPFVSTHWQGTVEYGVQRDATSAAHRYVVTESGRYYLRAYDEENQCWGIPSFIDITIDLPGLPPAPTVSKTCGSTTLTRPSAPAGENVTYYWQNSAEGTDTDTFNSSNSLTFTSDDEQPLYLKGLNDDGCWGEALSVDISVDEIIEVITPDVDYYCSSVVVSFLRSTDDVRRYKLTDENNELVDHDDNGPYGPFRWTLTQDGDYSFEIDDPNGFIPCKGDPIPIVISGLNIIIPANAGLDISGFANGNIISLTGMSPPGGTWSGTGITDAQSNEFNSAGLSPGDYVIHYNYTSDVGCSSSDSRTVTLLEAPEITVNGSLFIMPGNKVEISVNDDYDSYQWKKNGVNIVGATSHNYYVVKPGNYTVNVASGQASVDATPVLFTDASAVLDNNFVRTYTFNTEGVQSSDNLLDLNSDDFLISTDYFDGLGRLLQSVNSGQSPNCFDVVLPFEYEYGRQTKEYLPYVAKASDGLFKPNALNMIDYSASRQYEFYQTADDIEHAENPYAEREIERAPSPKVFGQGAPGGDWGLSSSHHIEFTYTSNRLSDHIKYWKVIDGSPQIITEYSPKDLLSDVTIDEHQHKVISFTNRLGQTILKRVQAHENNGTAEWADTYYVYDDLGNLRFVLPPEFNKAITEPITYPYSPTLDLLNNWAFQYKYDYRKRMIEKKVPGAEIIYLVYDYRDRLVLTQDGNQRLENKWLFTKYDLLNRPILTGETVIADDLDDIRNNLASVVASELPGNTVHGYTNFSYPSVSNEDEYLTVTYYDNYDFLNQADFGSDYVYDPDQLDDVTIDGKVYPFPDKEHNSLIGQVTGAKTKSLSSGNWFRSVPYYDKRYRVIQAISQNHVGGVDKSSTIFNLPGWVLKSRVTHQFPGKPLRSTERRFVYDRTGRLLQGYHQIFEAGIGNGEVLLAENHYNELGELVEKNLHVESGVPAQSVDYRYNIRGWLKNINTGSLEITPEINENDPTPDYFGMNILYNTSINTSPSSN